MKNLKFPKGIEVVSSALIVNKKGEILLTKSPKWHDKWTIPGGHVEPGETLEAAAEREGREETGLSLEVKKFINCGELIDSPDFFRPAHFIFFHYICELKSGDIKLESNELTEYKWFEPGEALKLDIVKGLGTTIEKYIENKNR